MKKHYWYIVKEFKLRNEGEEPFRKTVATPTGREAISKSLYWAKIHAHQLHGDQDFTHVVEKGLKFKIRNSEMHPKLHWWSTQTELMSYFYKIQRIEIINEKTYDWIPGPKKK